MKLRDSFFAFLKNSKATRLLFTLNIIISVVIFFLLRNKTGGDTATYLGLADGILSGNYSYWHFLENPFPDTFRNPGYPLFLAIIRIFEKSVITIQIIQLLLYFFSIRLVLSILDLTFQRIEINNLFLMFLLPAIYMPAYTKDIFPEILVTFLIILSFRIQYGSDDSKIYKYIILGLLYGFIFQVRPVFVLFPILLTAFHFFTKRSTFSWKGNILLLSIFFITMIPYGLWNKKNHGVFKITSLEGGGGVFQLGYWSFKMPDYTENRYWGNSCPRELVQFINEKDRSFYINEFNAEWDRIDSAIAPLLLPVDSLMLLEHQKHPSLLKTYNSNYTIKREELLKKFTIENISNDIPYYLKTKTYSALRLWITGVPLKDFQNAGFLKRIYLLYPLIITLITFLAFVILIPLAFARYKFQMSKTLDWLLIALYFGLIHIPFTIQSRYTIPVRLEVLMILAVAVYFIFISRKAEKTLFKTNH